jgi:hypothetical protein
VAVDIDTDDPDMVAAIMKVLPQSPVAKRGKRGRTLFYRGADKVKTTSFKFGPDDGPSATEHPAACRASFRSC